MSNYNVSRFVEAQANHYPAALAEIRNGRKVSHWMWYIFPQIAGLGMSAMSQKYAIRDLGEASVYLQHPVLGARLVEISEALVGLGKSDAYAVFGSPDDMKLRSSMTLFSLVPGADPVFEKVLGKFFSGEKDRKTLAIAGVD